MLLLSSNVTDYKQAINKIVCGDAFELLSLIPDHAVDMVMTDPPYGTTACKWDIVPNLELLWNHLRRIVKRGGACVFTASQPFTTDLINSNRKWFKYCWVWDKGRVSNPQLAKVQPLKHHEDIVVFASGKCNYFPQGLIQINNAPNKDSNIRPGDANGNEKLGHIARRSDYVQEFTGYPRMIIKFPRDSRVEHPTQKPVALLEYLIKTYTSEGALVLDPFMGSWTTAVACRNTGRNWIGSEQIEQYCQIGEKRITL